MFCLLCLLVLCLPCFVCFGIVPKKWTVMAILVADWENIKCYLIGLDEFKYSEENEVKSLEEYTKQIAAALKKVKLLPTQNITVELFEDMDKEIICLVGFCGDGVFLAELEENDAGQKVPIIDTHIKKYIQDTPLLQPTRHDPGHQRQNSWNSSTKNSEVVWKRNLASRGITTLRTPKLFNWGYNEYQRLWDLSEIDANINSELFGTDTDKVETRRMPSYVPENPGNPVSVFPSGNPDCFFSSQKSSISFPVSGLQICVKKTM